MICKVKDSTIKSTVFSPLTKLGSNYDIVFFFRNRTLLNLSFRSKVHSQKILHKCPLKFHLIKSQIHDIEDRSLLMFLTSTLNNHIDKVQQLILVVATVVRVALGSVLHDDHWLVVGHLPTVLVCVCRAS